MPVSANSPFDSTAATPAVGVCFPPTTAKCCRHPANSVQAIAISRPDAKPQPVVVTVLRQLPSFLNKYGHDTAM